MCWHKVCSQLQINNSGPPSGMENAFSSLNGFSTQFFILPLHYRSSVAHRRPLSCLILDRNSRKTSLRYKLKRIYQFLWDVFVDHLVVVYLFRKPFKFGASRQSWATSDGSKKLFPSLNMYSVSAAFEDLFSRAALFVIILLVFVLWNSWFLHSRNVYIHVVFFIYCTIVNL